MPNTDEYGPNMPVVTTGPNGEVILIDPVFSSIAAAIDELSCKALLDDSIERVNHFVQRMHVLGQGPSDVVIVLLSMDDPVGSILGDLLMPNFDWQGIRDAGEMPLARGLANRDGVQAFLNDVNPSAAEKLHLCNDVAVLVMSHGQAVVYTMPW